MSSNSNHLKDIFEKPNRNTTLQVVFVDIEKYSKRKTLYQNKIIDSFTKILEESLTETARIYLSQLQNRNKTINLGQDTILLPTGDGAAIIFPFEDINDLHISFAKILLEKIHQSNETNKCLIFGKENWCNCHPNFGVRIGISKGEGIIYKDFNKNYNVAGQVINYAARVMGLADSSQIIFTEDAYKNFDDLSEDPFLTGKFNRFNNIRIKHNETITIYQYIGKDEVYINRDTPKAILADKKTSVTILNKKETLPIFIATDIEGCITPQNRGEIDLSKLEKLNAYCQFVKSNSIYPQIVFFTGRSQGYVELLAQCLGMINGMPLDLPCVIENGAALYFPMSKKTIPLTSNEQLKVINETKNILISAFSENRFEPKGYMITINNREDQIIEDLHSEIKERLRDAGVSNELETGTSATAIDITAKGINKLSGVLEILSYYKMAAQTGDLQNIVAVGDHTSDYKVLDSVGIGYCPSNAHLDVKTRITKKFGDKNIIDADYVDLILHIIKEECGIAIK